MLRYRNRFYVIPGKDHNVSIDVLSKKNDDDEHLIKESHFEGFNILRKDDSSSMSDRVYPMKLSKLKQHLSEKMVIPKNQLTLISSLEEDDKILFPYGVSVEK